MRFGYAARGTDERLFRQPAPEKSDDGVGFPFTLGGSGFLALCLTPLPGRHGLRPLPQAALLLVRDVFGDLQQAVRLA